MKGFRTKNYVIHEITSSRDMRGRGKCPELPRETPYSQRRVDKLYACVARWLVRNDIRSVAGPVCSGAVMAYAISVASGNKIVRGFTSKVNGEYSPAQHRKGFRDGFDMAGRFVVVDDLIASGSEIMHTIQECASNIGQNPKAILCFSCFTLGFSNIKKKYPSIPIFQMGFRRAD